MSMVAKKPSMSGIKRPSIENIPMDGVLIVNKPSGMTSHDVVDEVRKAIKNKRTRVGHTGTLDPMATGVLPLCVGKATKLVQFLMSQEKEYRVTMRLGVESNTQDISGDLSEEKPVPEFSEQEIRDVLSGFVGEQLQTPPMISAKHHKGKRLYELAREGVEVEREPCKIMIHELELLAVQLPEIQFRVVSGKGAYIRTLCHDIGQTLKTGAVMSGLVRVSSGAFHLDNSVELEACKTRDNVSAHLMKMSDALSAFPNVVVGVEGKSAIACGRSLSGGLIKRREGEFSTGAFVRITTRDGALIAIGEALMASSQLTALAGNLNVLKPVKVFGAGARK